MGMHKQKTKKKAFNISACIKTRLVFVLVRLAVLLICQNIEHHSSHRVERRD